MSTLEVLRAAKARLEGEPFDFTRFVSCTCGHIYAAAEGAPASEGFTVMTGGGEHYPEVIIATARALGWDGSSDYGPTISEGEVATRYVSDLTLTIASIGRTEDDPDVDRAHALVVVEKAIAVIEAEQEANRLDVLAQARQVVDAVELDERVVA